MILLGRWRAKLMKKFHERIDRRSWFRFPYKYSWNRGNGPFRRLSWWRASLENPSPIIFVSAEILMKNRPSHKTRNIINAQVFALWGDPVQVQNARFWQNLDWDIDVIWPRHVFQGVELPQCMSRFSLAPRAKSGGFGRKSFNLERFFSIWPVHVRARHAPETSQCWGSSESLSRFIMLFTLDVSNIATAVVDVLDLHAASEWGRAWRQSNSDRPRKVEKYSRWRAKHQYRSRIFIGDFVGLHLKKFSWKLFMSPKSSWKTGRFSWNFFSWITKNEKIFVKIVALHHKKSSQKPGNPHEYLYERF